MALGVFICYAVSLLSAPDCCASAENAAKVGAPEIAQNRAHTCRKFGDRMRPLTEDERQFLESYDWPRRVSQISAAWISVDEQKFRVIEEGWVLWETDCATSALGTGSRINTHKTPLGWHRVARKVGYGAPWGQVFRGRVRTETIWRPGQQTSEDLVLTRILVLDGEEPGKNKGGEVDSMARNIYVHGTNAEDAVGTPSSHGCVRLRNDDVIIAFDLLPEEARVLITERAPKNGRESQ